jgi:ketosteroid isomerase-like protein
MQKRIATAILSRCRRKTSISYGTSTRCSTPSGGWDRISSIPRRWPDIWAQLAPDFEMRSRPDVPDQAVFRGREESKEFFRLLQEVFVELIWQPREFTDLGHAVVVEARINFVGRGSDVRIEEDETHVFWFRDGLISRLQPFPMREQALEAAQEPA